VPRSLPLQRMAEILYPKRHVLGLPTQQRRIVEYIFTHPTNNMREVADGLHKPYHTVQSLIWHLMYYAYRTHYGDLDTPRAPGRDLR
jgi:hypothetical protein